MVGIRIALTRLDEMKPAGWNPRTITEFQMRALMESLTQFGAVEPVVLNKDGLIIGGHQRYAAAKSLGWMSYPAVRVDVSKREARLLNLALNKISGDWDEAALAQVIASITDEPVELLEAGFDADEVAALLASLEEPAPVSEDPGPRSVPKTPKTRPGDVYVMGDHRLLCGDATSDEAMTRLMVGHQCEMVWTDPPYGVGVGEKNRYLNSIARSNRVEDDLAGDTLSEVGLGDLLRRAFAEAVKVCAPGGAWYVAAPAGPLQLQTGAVLHELGIWHQTLQWVKNNATFSPMGVDYHWQAEPIFYGWASGAAHRYYGGRKQTTVWEIDRPRASPEHPTMKPVELVSRALVNSSKAGELVLDMFGGSGSTLVAAEQDGRVCYMMEVDPRYCDVIVDRWERMTDQKAVRER